MNDRVRLLLVEDNPGDARLIREMLRDAPEMEILYVDTLAAGLDKLGEEPVDAVLLDLGLPDSQGLDTLAAVHDRFWLIPIVVLTGNSDEQLALEAVKAGAQDYLSKDGVDRDRLVRAIRYARERAGIEKALRTSEERLKRSHQKLQDTTMQLIQTAKLVAVGELTAGVAHELNQPLNSIRIISQSILRYFDSYEPDDLKSDVTEILEMVRKMAEMIEHMSIFTRSADYLEKRDIDVNTPLQEALKFVRQQLEHKSIRLATDLTAGLPTIKGDSVRLEQVFLNLITNARHALEDSEQDVKRMEIRSYLADVTVDGDACPSVVVEIVDNGPGVPEAVKDQIFLPFFTTKETGKGTGLGLSISQKIIEQHGGRVSLYSREGGGETVFKVVLPLQPPMSAADRNSNVDDTRAI